MTTADELAALATEIKAHRLRLGLTQQEMADRMDVTLSTVWRWEKGESRPDFRSRKRLRRLTK